MATGPIWRCVVDPPRDGAANMAIDQALFEGVQAGGRPVLRLYRWEPPCLSFGCNQIARGIYDPARAAARGIDIVRRPTGGLAVYHDRELTYAVAASTAALGLPRHAYASINRALAAGLATLGIDAAVAGPAHGPAASPGDAMHPCFGEAAHGELIAAGRKLVGSAMRVEKRTLLQHGSMLLDGDQSEVDSLRAGIAARIAAPHATSLREAAGRIPDWTELYDAVQAGFEGVLGITFEPDRATAVECGRARTLEEKYRSNAWTWRR